MKLLVTDNEIVQRSMLGGAIDVERLRQCVLDAQVTRLEELLGQELFDYFQDTATSTGLYATLLTDYIKPFLIKQSELEYLKIGAFNIANNGIFLQAPQNTQAITDKNISLLIAQARSKADMFADRMVRWLCKNNLPEYNRNSDNIVNYQKNSIGSWFIPKQYNRKEYEELYPNKRNEAFNPECE
jgi:hypothetical protein